MTMVMIIISSDAFTQCNSNRWINKSVFINGNTKEDYDNCMVSASATKYFCVFIIFIFCPPVNEN